MKNVPTVAAVVITFDLNIIRRATEIARKVYAQYPNSVNVNAVKVAVG